MAAPSPRIRPAKRQASVPSPSPADRCPHDRAVVDACTDAGMACRCLACGQEFVEPWRGGPSVPGADRDAPAR